MIKQYLMAAAGLLTIIACNKTEDLTAEEKNTITNDVRKFLNNYYDDIRASGLTAEFSYLDKSKDFFWVPPGYSAAISYDSVAAVIEQNAPLFKSVDNVWDTLQVIPLGNELAVYTGRLYSNMMDTSGKISGSILVETGFVVKRKDGWKLLCGQTRIAD